MSIKLEYIVCNKKGDELKRFDIKADAEAYDSVICAAEDISLLLEPLQKELSISEEQVYSISEYLAIQSDEVKLALKQIKKPKSTLNAQSNSNEKPSKENVDIKTPIKKPNTTKTSK